MNAAVLTRIRVISGTTEEVIQTIREVAKQQRLSGLLETVLYHLPDKPDEIFALSMWDKLSNIPSLDEYYKKLVNQEILGKAEVVSRYTYRLIKEYRTVSASIGASYLRLVTLQAVHSQEWITQAVNTMAQVKASGIGVGQIGSWIGQRIDDEQDEKTVSFIARHDWRSVEDQQAFQKNQLVREVRARTQAMGAEVEFASLDLAGLVRLELEEV
jgi:heme-degrading monooxygenase HmoA